MGCVDQFVEFVLVTPDLLETAQSTPSLMSYPPSYVSGVETESVRDVHHAMLAIIIRVGNSGARAAAAAASITSSAAPPPLKSEAFTQLPATLQSALYLFLPLFPSLGPSNVPTTCAALCSYAWLHDRDRDEG